VSAPEFAVFDLDGVLADVRHRLHFVEHKPKDWGAFFSAAPMDPPLADGLAAVAAEAHLGRTIVYVTGRPERCREDTIAWLAEHGFPPGPLTMRADDDRRPARILKPGLIRRLQGSGTVAVMYDDDASVVTALSVFNFDVVHVQWMDTAIHEQQALFGAQEDDGRT
jgi:hypothetical protein